MNYKDLIDRLRDIHPDIHYQDEALFQEAADVIESLTAQLAAGPTVWMYEDDEGNCRYRSERISHYAFSEKETPLYPIPTGE